MSERLRQTLWHIDMTALFHDLAVDELSDLGHAVICWAKELKCLPCSFVIVANLLKSFANIDCLH